MLVVLISVCCVSVVPSPITSCLFWRLWRLRRRSNWTLICETDSTPTPSPLPNRYVFIFFMFLVWKPKSSSLKAPANSLLPFYFMMAGLKLLNECKEKKWTREPYLNHFSITHRCEWNNIKYSFGRCLMLKQPVYTLLHIAEAGVDTDKQAGLKLKKKKVGLAPWYRKAFFLQEH